MTLRFNNFALAVGDLDTMIGFYVGTLGFTLAERGRFDAVGADYAMIDGAGLRIELVSRPASPRSAVEPVDPPDHLGQLGWRALVLESDDLATATAMLRARGVTIVWAEHDISETHRSTLIRDPEGNLINIFAAR